MWEIKSRYFKGGWGGSSLDRVLWCGDFNSHNSLWGSNGTDANGSVIEEFIDYHNLVCINSGEGTRYNSIQNTESPLDLTFVSSALAGISTCGKALMW